jgi:hypothetical protein
MSKQEQGWNGKISTALANDHAGSKALAALVGETEQGAEQGAADANELVAEYSRSHAAHPRIW